MPINRFQRYHLCTVRAKTTAKKLITQKEEKNSSQAVALKNSQESGSNLNLFTLPEYFERILFSWMFSELLILLFSLLFSELTISIWFLIVVKMEKNVKILKNVSLIQNILLQLFLLTFQKLKTFSLLCQQFLATQNCGLKYINWVKFLKLVENLAIDQTNLR